MHPKAVLWLVALVLALTAVFFVFRFAASQSMTVILDEQNGSGQSGTATLEDVAGGTRITAELNLPAGGFGLQPFHIHSGTCDNLGPIVFPLSDLASRSLTEMYSETIVSESLNQILARAASGPLAMNAHHSYAQPGLYTACGNLLP